MPEVHQYPIRRYGVPETWLSPEGVRCYLVSISKDRGAIVITYREDKQYIARKLNGSFKP